MGDTDGMQWEEETIKTKTMVDLLLYLFFAEGSLEGTILFTEHKSCHSGKGAQQMWDLKLKDSHAGYTNWYADMLLY